MVQCARLSFGLVGIYDADEAESKADAIKQQEINLVEGRGPTRSPHKAGKRTPMGVAELKQSLSSAY
jgi:hypothetical protein